MQHLTQKPSVKEHNTNMNQNTKGKFSPLRTEQLKLCYRNSPKYSVLITKKLNNQQNKRPCRYLEYKMCVGDSSCVFIFVYIPY